MTKVVYCGKHYLDVVLSEGKCFRCLIEDEELGLNLDNNQEDVA